jgi:flavodoxin
MAACQRKSDMKCIIVYYSATGNTAKIAKAIYRGLKSINTNSEIARMKEISPSELAQYDLIGLGSPIWAGREPLHVSAFLNDMPDLHGKLGFPFCVHGAQPIGFMYYVSAACKKVGYLLSAMAIGMAVCFRFLLCLNLILQTGTLMKLISKKQRILEGKWQFGVEG